MINRDMMKKGILNEWHIVMRGLSVGQRMNPNRSYGKPLLCKACGSYRHFIAQCPYSWENLQDPNVWIVEQEEENVVLFTTSQSHMGSISEIGIEARNAAVLDSECSSMVCGQEWMNEYKNSLNSEDLKKIVVMDENIQIWCRNKAEKSWVIYYTH